MQHAIGTNDDFWYHSHQDCFGFSDAVLLGSAISWRFAVESGSSSVLSGASGGFGKVLISSSSPFCSNGCSRSGLSLQEWNLSDCLSTMREFNSTIGFQWEHPLHLLVFSPWQSIAGQAKLGQSISTTPPRLTVGISMLSKSTQCLQCWNYAAKYGRQNIDCPKLRHKMWWRMQLLAQMEHLSPRFYILYLKYWVMLHNKCLHWAEVQV